MVALKPVIVAIVVPFARTTPLTAAKQPVLVIAVGLFFYFFVLPGLLDDLEEGRAASR